MPTPSESARPVAPQSPDDRTAPQSHFERELASVTERIADEAKSAVGMLESALAALWVLNTQSAAEILKVDDRIDEEEVAIEEAAFRLMTLRQPVARDFRNLAFILKANADIERVGDHACSIAKIVFKLADQPRPLPPWPTSLVELGQRVPMVCHALLRALLDEDAAAASAIVAGDGTIDRLARQLFDEAVAMMGNYPNQHAAGLLIFRCGRELERVGDLMTNIAEDIVYLVTGEIVRHEKKKRLRAASA